MPISNALHLASVRATPVARPVIAWAGGLALCWLLGTGCLPAASDELAPLPSGDLLAADAAAYAAAPRGFEALTASRLPTDASGLLGRNRTWGALHSPRFQLGAGSALRTTLAARRPTEAAQAFRALEAGTETIQANGFVPSTLPRELRGQPSATDVASAAAFFLGDACLGLHALEASKPADRVASPARREAAQASVGRAIGWLLSQRDRLSKADETAPNRLLFDALAFQACSAFAPASERPGLHREAAAFVDAALELYRPDGVFIEGGGHDTSYQGVALRVGEDVLLAGYPDDEGRLGAALAGAATWLTRRVDADGRIDSSGNTRTCEGGETALGKPKRVAVSDGFTGLAYSAVRTGAESSLQAARRIESWALAHAGSDPCFPSPSSAPVRSSVESGAAVSR